MYLAVRLRASFTEVGTLELWCESRETPHRWRLQFELRGEKAQDVQLDTPKPQAVRECSPAVETPDATVESAAQLIKNVFGDSANSDSVAPEALIAQMEAVLNLTGFCLRPGFGAQVDGARVGKLLKFVSNDPIFADDLQCRVGVLVSLRRIAGGIHANDQQALYRKHASPPGSKKKRINQQIESEKWRLVANLEHLQASIRASRGHELLAKIRKEPGDAIWLWSLGRLGARIPLYGPLHSVVEPEIASEWLKAQ